MGTSSSMSFCPLATLVLMVTKDLTDRFQADELIKEVAEMVGGRGGGSPTMAQAGVARVEKLNDALEAIYEIVEKRA